MSSNGVLYNLVNYFSSLFDKGGFSGVDYSGNQSFNSVFGESITSPRYDDVRLQFQYNISTYEIKTLDDGGGGVEAVNEDSKAILRTINNNATTYCIRSKANVRYRPGHMSEIQMTARATNPRTGVKQIWGMCDATDGISFGTKDGIFGIFIIDNSNETFIPQADFNKDTLDGNTEKENVIDIEKLNMYQIRLGWLGVSPIQFSVRIDGKWVLCHEIDDSNSATSPLLRNASLPISLRLIQEAGTTHSESTVESAAWRGGSVFNYQSSDPGSKKFSHESLQATTTGGSYKGIYFIHSRSTFFGKENHIVARTIRANFTNNGNKPVFFSIYNKNDIVLDQEPNYTFKDEDQSILEYSSEQILLTQAPDSARVVTSVAVGRENTVVIDLDDNENIIYPDEEYVLVVYSVNAIEISSILTIEELF